MYFMYTEGATLEEVGNRFHLSRQRVQQIFQEASIPTRSATETHALRRERLFRKYGEKARELFAKSKDINVVAKQLGITRTAARELKKQQNH